MNDEEQRLKALEFFIGNSKPQILRAAAKAMREQAPASSPPALMAAFSNVFEASALAHEAGNVSLTDDAVWGMSMSLLMESLKG